MVFGDSVLLLLSLAPYGGEDFPKYVKKDLDELASKNGFSNCLLIDSHNSRGEAPRDSDCGDLISVAGALLGEMKFMRQTRFRVGYAHSSELNEVLTSDVGPGGISIIMFELEGRSFSIVSADSNNIVIGFRERVASLLNNNLIEFCTTDTHFNASKVMNPLGYLALGDVSKAEDIASVINRLANSANNRVVDAGYEVKMIRDNVNVVGGNVLDNFSMGLDKMIRYARLGGIVSSVFIISIIMVSIVI
jgi:predicted neutral ceramidase superfamily lipid hydrolase